MQPLQRSEQSERRLHKFTKPLGSSWPPPDLDFDAIERSVGPAVDDLSALVDAGARPDLAGRNWPNKTSQPRSSAPPASQTDYIAIAPGIGVFDLLRHYGRFTRPPGEVTGPPIGVHGYSAQAAPKLVRALHRQTIPNASTTLGCAAFAPLHAASTTANCPRRKMYYPTSLVRRFWSTRKRNEIRIFGATPRAVVLNRSASCGVPMRCATQCNAASATAQSPVLPPGWFTAGRRRKP